jgi:hypothetical protein
MRECRIDQSARARGSTEGRSRTRTRNFTPFTYKNTLAAIASVIALQILTNTSSVVPHVVQMQKDSLRLELQ